MTRLPVAPSELSMRLPGWLKSRYKQSDLRGVKSILRRHRVHSVCEEARCPNRAGCYSKPTAAFMILGDSCTRSCGFCAVNSSAPRPLDLDEPRRVAQAVKEMALRFVVITSVTRDDLDDGGARQFVNTIQAVRAEVPGVKVELLIPDFRGGYGALRSVLQAAPDVLNHNVETVPRLYPEVRPQAVYARSLELLSRAREIAPLIRRKSGLMLGLGETFEEVMAVLVDLKGAGCDILTVGQYLRPDRFSLPVKEYVKPGVFRDILRRAYGMGFTFVASSPETRSSMNADEMYSR